MTILFDLSNCIMVSFSWKLLTKSIDRICLPGFLFFFLCRNLVGAQFNFTDATLISGIDFKHYDGRSGKRYFTETLGSGAAWFDYDQDGDPDIFFVNGASLDNDSGTTPPTNKLYRNNGDGTFTDVTKIAGVDDTGYGFGCCIGDYNNDGFSDLYVTNFGPNLLYHNNGDGTFSNVGKQANVADSRWGTSCAFSDYDRDGHLDLFVANYVDYQLNDHQPCQRRNLQVYCPPADFVGTPDILYRNNGDGTFTDTTLNAGLVPTENGKGLGVVWGDYDNDGYPDLSIANDTTPDMLYRNNGDGTFIDIALFVGVALGMKGVALGGMGVNFGDYNNDGWLDLVVTNFEADPNGLFLNDKDGAFVDEAYAAKFGGIGTPYVGWGVDFVDFDNDGYQDIFVANGHIYDNAEEIHEGVNTFSSYAQLNHCFLNLRDGSFSEVSGKSGLGLLINKVSRGATFADYDNDGDLDILITNSNQKPDLLRNDISNTNYWLIVHIVSDRNNGDGVGTRVKITTGRTSQIREVKSGSSYLCQSDMRLHFGLGKSAYADQIEVLWTSGLVEKTQNVKANQRLYLKEGAGIVKFNMQ